METHSSSHISKLLTISARKVANCFLTTIYTHGSGATWNVATSQYYMRDCSFGITNDLYMHYRECNSDKRFEVQTFYFAGRGMLLGSDGHAIVSTYSVTRSFNQV